MMNLLTKSIILCLVFTLVSVRPVYAYIDPGTGSMVLQGILAVVMAAFLFVKFSWRKVLMFIGIKKDTDLVTDDNDSDSN